MSNSLQIDNRHIRDIEGTPRISEVEQAKQFKIFRENHVKDPVTKEEKERSVLAEKAAEKIIVGNMKLVLKLAIDMYREKLSSRFGTTVSLNDLIQDGYIGLCKAVNISFDDKNSKFSTYAGTSITRHMKKTFQLNRMVQIPVNHDEIMGEICGVRAKYDGDITDEEVAKELGITLSYLKLVVKGQKSSLPLNDLDAMIDKGFDIPRQTEPQSVDGAMASSELKEYLLSKIDTLSKKEQDIVRMKFFNDIEMSNAEIGDKMGVSRQRVDYIYWGAVKKLKKKLSEDDALGNSDICQELIQLKGQKQERDNNENNRKKRSNGKTAPKSKSKKSTIHRRS